MLVPILVLIVVHNHTYVVDIQTYHGRAWLDYFLDCVTLWDALQILSVDDVQASWSSQADHHSVRFMLISYSG